MEPAVTARWKANEHPAPSGISFSGNRLIGVDEGLGFALPILGRLYLYFAAMAPFRRPSWVQAPVLMRRSGNTEEEMILPKLGSQDGLLGKSHPAGTQPGLQWAEFFLVAHLPATGHPVTQIHPGQSAATGLFDLPEDGIGARAVGSQLGGEKGIDRGQPTGEEIDDGDRHELVVAVEFDESGIRPGTGEKVQIFPGVGGDHLAIPVATQGIAPEEFVMLRYEDRRLLDHAHPLLVVPPAAFLGAIGAELVGGDADGNARFATGTLGAIDISAGAPIALVHEFLGQADAHALFGVDEGPTGLFLGQIRTAMQPACDQTELGESEPGGEGHGEVKISGLGRDETYLIRVPGARQRILVDPLSQALTKPAPVDILGPQAKEMIARYLTVDQGIAPVQ